MDTFIIIIQIIIIVTIYFQFIKKCLFNKLFHEQFTIFTPYDVLQFNPSLVTIWPAASCRKISHSEYVWVWEWYFIPLFLSIAPLTHVSSFGVLTQTTLSSARPKKVRPLMALHAMMGRYHSAFHADPSRGVGLNCFLCVYVFALLSSSLSTVLKATVCSWLQTS